MYTSYQRVCIQTVYVGVCTGCMVGCQYKCDVLVGVCTHRTGECVNMPCLWVYVQAIWLDV